MKRQSCRFIETSANQLPGFYMMVTLAFNELIFSFQLIHSMQLKKKRFAAPISADYVIRKFAT